MLAKRIIPCLDIKDNKVVKGVNFVGLREIGDPVEICKIYNEQGADELVFLDINASLEGRRPVLALLEKVAECIFIPLTLGGGICSIKDVVEALKAGADKVSINSAAVRNPDLIKKLADKVGSQAIVLAVDAKFDSKSKKWLVFTHGGRKKTGIDAVEWCYLQSKNGAGEILLTSMDKDGTKTGFDLDLLKAVNELIDIPLIASGGVGCLQHFIEAAPYCDALLAASVFHCGQLSIKQVKKQMQRSQIQVRL